MPERHRPSCAKQWRERAVTEQWGIERLVSAIHDCCGVSRLRAHRLARGWTLRVAVAEFRHMCSEAGVVSPPKVDEDQLAVWEKRPDHRPRASTVDLLCRLYRTDSQSLGLVGDYSRSSRSAVRVLPPAVAHVQEGDDENSPVACRPVSDSVAIDVDDPVDRLAGAVRRSVDRTLASAGVTSG